MTKQHRVKPAAKSKPRATRGGSAHTRGAATSSKPARSAPARGDARGATADSGAASDAHRTLVGFKPARRSPRDATADSPIARNARDSKPSKQPARRSGRGATAGGQPPVDAGSAAASARPGEGRSPGASTLSGAPIGPLVVAIPKGRVLKALARRLAPLGVDANVLLSDDRTLVRDDPNTNIRFLLLKPDDVPTYVEYGAADLGVVGRDVLLEREYDLYAPLDLGIGICKMVVAGKTGEQPSGRPLRVATKFTNIANRYFLGKGQQVDLVYVQGSVELAPLTGLADVIVDLVESGETLRQNGLSELEYICRISSVIVANRVALKLKRAAIAPVLDALRE